VIESISAVTLATHDMDRSVAFYEALGFALHYGGSTAEFTTFRTGAAFLNLIKQDARVTWSWWGRIIFQVGDVDAFYQEILDRGFKPEAPPRDAEWGERYFQLIDPDGHELSFMHPLHG
jgi:catechol 2,3-dioxygenase-like lactoylglutathione lyase family enzyme